MKLIYPLIVFLLFSGTLFGQVGIGTEQPNIRAVLDLKSPANNQGFLAPRPGNQRALKDPQVVREH